MKRFRIVVELDEDELDELDYFHGVDILFVENADVEESGITYEEQKEV